MLRWLCDTSGSNGCVPYHSPVFAQSSPSLSLNHFLSLVQPKELHWQDWIDGQPSKVTRSIPILAKRKLPDPASEVFGLDGIAAAISLWYVDRRAADSNWRELEGGKELEAASSPTSDSTLPAHFCFSAAFCFLHGWSSPFLYIPVYRSDMHCVQVISLAISATLVVAERLDKAPAVLSSLDSSSLSARDHVHFARAHTLPSSLGVSDIKKKKRSCRRRTAEEKAAAVNLASTKNSETKSKTVFSPYTLTQHSIGGSSTFFDAWDFFSLPDPTHGAVEYVSAETAWANGLVESSASGNSTILRVDSWSKLGYGENRQSVRITSKEKVKFGSVVVIDVDSMPFGPTVWPAFWTVGDNWPEGGEIDIIEGVHDQAANQATLHTGAGCTLKSPVDALGSVLETDCNAYVNGNIGCGIQDPSDKSFGSALNKAGGGTFAMTWNEDGVAVYFFPRGTAPSDLTSDSPTPSTWGKPRARWAASTCDPRKFLRDQTAVINITIGGDWAGSTYNQAGYQGDWKAAVMDPKTYKDAQWEINYVKVFQMKE
ncbi:hypothetical protein JCM11251_002961 [Rhodosporidiobolus azoricus]